MRCLAVAVLALCLGLSGCSGGPPTGPNGEVILTLLTHYGNDPLKAGLQKLVDEWNASPDVQVRTQAVAFEDLQATVTVRQVGGRGADIMNLYALWGGQAADANVLAEHDSSGNTTVNGIALLQGGDNESVHPFLSLRSRFEI